MKYEDSNAFGILKGKSFYVILAILVIAIGAAAFLTLNKATEPTKKDNTSIAENSSDINSSENELPDDTPSTDNVDTDTKEPYDQSSDNAPSEEPNPPVAANNFTMPLNGNILKNFSDKTLVYSNTYHDMRLHLGIDIVGKTGDSVRACGVGIVTAIVEDTKLGRYVEIDHGNGVVARYAGLDNVLVSEGDIVDAVTKLGTLGTVNEECLDTWHLHLEFFKDKKPVDPLSLIYPEK